MRKSTGALKHRRLGYVEIYFISQEYCSKHATDIEFLQQQNKISLSHHYKFFKEVIIESSIPKEYILGFQVFSLPKMDSEWSQSIQDQFGLDCSIYNSFRNRLKIEKSDNENNQILMELIQKVTAKQFQRLQMAVGNILSQNILVQQATNQSNNNNDIDSLSDRLCHLPL